MILNKEETAFFKQLFFKTLSMFGFTYFSVAVTLQSWTIITPSLLSAGLYFFAEMCKYYKLQPDNKVLAKKIKYSFII